MLSQQTVKAMFSVVDFEAEFSQDSLPPIHGRVNSATLLCLKDLVEIYFFASRDVRESVGLYTPFAWKRQISVQEDPAKLEGQQFHP